MEGCFPPYISRSQKNLSLCLWCNDQIPDRLPMKQVRINGIRQLSGPTPRQSYVKHKNKTLPFCCTCWGHYPQLVAFQKDIWSTLEINHLFFIFKEKNSAEKSADLVRSILI